MLSNYCNIAISEIINYVYLGLMMKPSTSIDKHTKIQIVKWCLLLTNDVFSAWSNYLFISIKLLFRLLYWSDLNICGAGRGEHAMDLFLR